MRFLKNNLKLIIGFIIGAILASSITVYAYSYFAKDISYTKPGTDTSINVETALNELYSKSSKTPQQVATLTEQGATYTFQNDGYILGTATGYSTQTVAAIYYNDDERPLAIGGNWTANVSLYVTKNTTIKTRDNYGTYNLTCYEFK